MVDKKYCSSSFLMYRTIADRSKLFDAGLKPRFYEGNETLHDVHNADELENSLKTTISELCDNKKVALALSGGIDSAILAKYMPEGSYAYTFKCVVPGVQVTDESIVAARYAKECGLKHRIIEINWQDIEDSIDLLMKHKGAPCHSIEVQIYKAGLRALEDGNDAIVFGESADANYGGLSGLLSREWTVGEFFDRYWFVNPLHALKDCEIITEPITQYEKDGFVDVHEFLRGFFFQESMGSYTNAGEVAGIEMVCPYAKTKMAVPLDYNRVRAGENKYIVRELFNRLYPGFNIPPKTPMPRPVDEWLKEWTGPSRCEFWPNCHHGMTGDQKFYVWVLERFLNMIS